MGEPGYEGERATGETGWREERWKRKIGRLRSMISDIDVRQDHLEEVIEWALEEMEERAGKEQGGAKTKELKRAVEEARRRLKGEMEMLDILSVKIGADM